MYSVVYEDAPGECLPFFNKIDIMNLPSLVKPKSPLAYTGKTFSPHMFSQTEDFVATPVPLSYYKYQGSKTQPPCTDHTVWYLVEQPFGLSTTTLAFIAESLKVPDYMKMSCGKNKHLESIDGNYRSVQDDHDRDVLFFDRGAQCGGDKNLEKFKQKDVPRGHYEKVKKNITEYLYISNGEPSGIPGALVVSKAEVDDQLGDKQKPIRREVPMDE